jgi:enoyl-[acyl-carrier protein] reductase I
VTQPESLDQLFAAVEREFGGLDGLVHGIAFAKREELAGDFFNTSKEGWALAQEVSAYSLLALTRRALPLMEGKSASIVTLTYIGGERVVPNYNVMGVAKAALEASVRYLANDLRPRGSPDSPRSSTTSRSTPRSGGTSRPTRSGTPASSSSARSRAASREASSTSTRAST